VPAEIPRAEAGRRSACLDDRGHGPGRDRLAADAGQGRGSSVRACRSSQIRRNTGPDLILAASCQTARHAGFHA
jgi:hypothetical protein